MLNMAKYIFQSARRVTILIDLKKIVLLIDLYWEITHLWLSCVCFNTISKKTTLRFVNGTFETLSWLLQTLGLYFSERVLERKVSKNVCMPFCV